MSEWPQYVTTFCFHFVEYVFICFDSLVIQFWVAVNAMVRLRPPGEGERLCTPWVLLSDLENPGLVTFENFWASSWLTCREGFGIELRMSHTPAEPVSVPIPRSRGCILTPFCIVARRRWRNDDKPICRAIRVLTKLRPSILL